MSFQERRQSASPGNLLSPAVTQMDQLIDVKKLLLPLLRFKWRIFAFALLVTALTVFVVLSMTPIY
ncbi:MAG: succinoglycan biosynthesis transport protein ExoP, partial [Cognaticolwellia sp.]